MNLEKFNNLMLNQYTTKIILIFQISLDFIYLMSLIDNSVQIWLILFSDSFANNG